jgi:phosphoribosylformylglycinamidine cyclo-ligase
LVRRVVQISGLGWDAAAPFAPDRTLGAALLEPTRIYVQPLLALHRARLMKAAAHITGGGLPGNLPRVLPSGTIARLAPNWAVPPVFPWLAHAGGILPAEMLRVFNCGIGMVVVVAEADVEAATTLLTEHGETVTRLGHIEAAQGPAEVRIGLPNGWPAG